MRRALIFNGTEIRLMQSKWSLELECSGNIDFEKELGFRGKMSRQPTRMADSKKVSGELFSLTYGALVAQIVKVLSKVENMVSTNIIAGL